MTYHLTRRDALSLAGVAAAGLATTGATAKSIIGGATVKKIGLEEHIMFPDFVGYLGETRPNILPSLFDKAVPILSDFGDRRLEVMDANGVDFAVLSISGPGVQVEPDTATAVRLARSANDRLGKEI